MTRRTIKNERLEVNFTISGKEYNGTRFDRMGMIKEVLLDNKDTFHARESLVDGQGSDGQGFYNEFGIEEPIGYDEIGVGEQFLKIGVGALIKFSHDKYDFFQDYDVELFSYDVKAKEDTITFISESELINGYAVRYVKTISINHNEMLIEYALTNTGQKDIDTTEYCHNFVAINNRPIGPEYELKFSYPLEVDVEVGEFEVDENKFILSKSVNEMFYCKLKNFNRDRNQHFELLHKPSKVGFKETSCFNLERVAIWGMPHVISPESFIKIMLKPGEKQTWSRVYTFYN